MEQGRLQERLPQWQVQAYQQLDSTQDQACRTITAGCRQPLLVIADEQTAGRGRYGRHFYSPRKTGLYLSLAIPTIQCPPGLFTLGLAVTVAHVLDQYFPTTPVKFKWVNDLYYHQHKVAGLLVECHAGMTICGIGINLTTAKFPHSLQGKAGALAGDHFTRRADLVVSLANRLLLDSPQYADGQSLTEYRRRSLVLNRQVTVRVNHQLIRGQAQAITDQGALVLQSDCGRVITIDSGEVVKVKLA